MDRSLDMVLSVMGIVKAGAAYVPLDPAWPAERIRWILASLEVSCVLSRRAQLRLLHELQWRLPKLTDVVCLDVAVPRPPPEKVDEGAVSALWDRVAEQATGRVSAGGFVSSYTGEGFSEAEVDEYVGRVVALAEPGLLAGKRVLEIGCGAGLIMFQLAPRAGLYVGLDPSEVTQARNRERVAAEGHDNVRLVTGFADAVASMEPGSFDLVIVASTAQFFPGPLYTERVIAGALRALAPGGRILLADVMDARRKEEFKESLIEFKGRHPAAKTKTDLGGELYFDEDFFDDLRSRLPELARVRVAHRARGFANELGYRFDVILEKAAQGDAGATPPPARKHLWTRWHLDQLADDNPSTGVTPEDIAYLIFTSGSTGTPKGVVIRHRAAVNLIDWVNRRHGIGPGDRLLFVTSLSFDLSVYDIFGTLAAGGAVHVASRDDLRDPQRLVQMMVDEGITFWDSAPAALQRLAPLFPPPGSGAETGRLRLVYLSGDWIPLSLPDQVRGAFPNAEVVGLGGATEATVWSNSFPVGRVEPHWASIPYGKPMPNAQYHVLDRHLNPCPVGVSGDLYIAGECLAVGYTDPALTAESFIPNPFSVEPGARMYRTGDRARYWADGNMEFLGRLDQQVKVRGFRIELGEIEAVLSQHPSVRDALVLVREVAGEKQLVAYLVPRTSPAPSAAELRGFIKDKLPEYMLPAWFVALDAIPLTPNGKVDRGALPAPEQSQLDRGGDFAPPRTPVEKAVAEIWARLLGRERVGLDENFFELGGHSLLATQVVSGIRESLEAELSLRTLFEEPTVAGLAEAVEAARSAARGRSDADGQGSSPEDGRGRERLGGEFAPPPDRPAPPLLPAPRGGPLPLSYAQQRLWFLDQLAPGNSAYNMLGGMRLRGRLDVEVLERAVNEIVRRHEALRTTFAAVDSRPVQVVAPSLAVGVNFFDLRALPEEEHEAAVEQFAGDEARHPFDLTRGPLLRVTLLRLSEEEHVALVTMHHIVSDGWSTAIFIREFEALYDAFVRGEPSPLPELTIQYADYARWQREWLEGEALASRVAYWKRALAGAPPTVELPADRPRPSEPTFRSVKLSYQVPDDLYGALQELSRRAGVTLYMTMLAAFHTLLYRYSGQEDICVGTAVAGRNHARVEGLIGVFINMLVMRADLSGNPKFSQLLGQVRETALEAYAHQDVPFDKLVEELQPRRALSHTPLFQVAFGVQNAAVRGLALPGLSLSPMSFNNEVARYDLTLWMLEGEGRLTASWTYSTDHFDASTITRMNGHYEALLRAVTAQPEARLNALNMLTGPEREQKERRESAWEEEGVSKLRPGRRRAGRRPTGAAADAGTA